MPWKKALRFWFPDKKTETDRTELFKKFWRSKLLRILSFEAGSQITELPDGKDNTAAMIDLFRKNGVGSDWYLKDEIEKWRPEYRAQTARENIKKRWAKKRLRRPRKTQLRNK